MSAVQIAPPQIDHVPSLDALEEDADRVYREVARLLERAKTELALVQDAEAELADSFTMSARMAGNAAAYRLRAITRQLVRAQCVLVHPEDERHQAAVTVLGWADEADRGDAPWRDAA